MNPDKARQSGSFVLVLVAMVLGVLIGVMVASNPALRRTSSQEDKIGEVTGLIESEYVDAIDPDSLSDRLCL